MLIFINRVTSAIRTLDQLQREIFSIYLRRNYQEKIYTYEKNLHVMRLRFLKLSATAKPDFDCWDHLFENIVALGNLRYRVSDPALFEVCDKELKSVTTLLSTIFNNLQSKKKSPIELAEFSITIQQFEEIFERTLHVVAKEPTAFLIFIQNLHALHKQLVGLT